MLKLRELPELAPPIRFAAEPARPNLREPLLGEHTNEILAELDAGHRAEGIPE